MYHLSRIIIVCLLCLIASNVYATPSVPFKIDPNVAYGEDAAQRMDVYAPKDVKDAPVIFMVHGGAWFIGDKSSEDVVKNKIDYWVSRGFVFISVNYRMVPKADPLQQEQDVAKALAFAQKRAPVWGGDPKKFILMGHSAGAHLVGLLAANPEDAFKEGALPWRGTVTLDSAALDVKFIMQHPHFGFYDRAFGDKSDFWEKASPFYQLTDKAGPVLLICSTQRLESCMLADKFAEKAKGLGVSAEVVRQDLTHMEINQQLGLPGDYTKAVDDFISKQIKDK